MSVEKEDKILFCRDCGEEFIFSAREQDFYAQKGFENDPVRCSSCRSVRKRTGGASVGAGSYNNTGAGNWGNGGYGNSNSNGGNGNNYGNSSHQGGYNQRGNYNQGNNYNSNYSNPRPTNSGYGGQRSNYQGSGYNQRGNYQGNNYGSQRSNYNSGYGNQRPNNYSNNYNQGGYNSNQRGNYNQGNSNQGNYNPNYNSQDNFDQFERKRYPIICATCGIKTEVPFVPRDGVPVFCRTCYNNQKPHRN